MKPEPPSRQLWRGNAPKVPEDWHFLLLENLTSLSRLVEISHGAECLSLGAFVGRGAHWRQSLRGYDEECEAELERVVSALLSDHAAIPCPLFLYWISAPEAIQDARLKTIFRNSGSSSLGEFVEKGASWRQQWPGYGIRAEEILQRRVDDLVCRTPLKAVRQIGEMACLLRHDAAELCLRLLPGSQSSDAIPLRLLRIRALQEVELGGFLEIFQSELAGLVKDRRKASIKQDLLEGFRAEDREALELELYIRAGELLSPQHWTPEICHRFVPGWVLERMVVASTSSPKLVRRAERLGWRSYADILQDTRRVGLPAFGAKAEGLLWEEIDRLARLGPVWDRFTSVQSRPRSLMEGLQASIERLSPRSALVISARMGLDGGVPQTLRQLGERLEVTRERVRQIEQAAWRQIKLREEWAPAFASQLDQLLQENSGVVPLALLGRDSWMKEAAVNQGVVNTLSQRLLRPPAYLYPSRGRGYIVELRRTHFDRLRLIFNRQIAKQQFPVPLQALIEHLSSKNPYSVSRPGFAGRFLKVFGPPLEMHENGQLLGPCDSLPSMIKRILSEEERPQHYEDIHEMLDQRSLESGLADPISIHQVRYHLISDPKILLFGPGLYGMAHHFPNLESLASLCTPAALQLMQCTQECRWSSNDLWQKLQGDLRLPGWFTHYHLGILLRRSPKLAYHGRLLFSRKK